ncbi:unnamed protein product [Schistosoma mattheei]|uniref:C-type lectin domain-containing protein n=1 Tax=Schistosoma mattheei TaxID=31246 RepID=A0AA85BBG0_9TREM|nr:unnamed protein product [Schistosoma mattheei]
MKKYSNCSSMISSYPSNPTEISINHNLKILTKTNNFCKANQLCSDDGKITNRISKLIGQNFMFAIEYFPNHSFWIKINQVNISQIKNSNLVNNWIDENSKLYLMHELESNFPSYKNQSMYDGKYTAYYNHLDNKIQTTLLNRTNEIDVICEIEKNTNHDQNHFIQLKRFRKCLNVNTEVLFSPNKDFDGCYSQNIMPSLQYCAYSCATDEYCTRFYYNNLTKDCIIAQYIVSLIPTYANRTNGWDCYSLN